MQLQLKSEIEIAVDDVNAPVIIAEEALEVLAVKGIQNVVWDPRRTVFEAIIANDGSMYLDLRLEI